MRRPATSKNSNPFDLNMDGKVDLRDHMLYDVFYGDDEKDTPHREVRWTNRDSEILGEIIGGIIGSILVIWIVVTLF